MSKWLSKLTSDFGMIAADLKSAELPVLPSRSPSLNWATSIGGFRPGKINILYGPESAGKSLIAMMAIADMQKLDKEAEAIWFDTEFSFNLDLFVKIGGDPKRLLVRQSNDPLTIFDYIGGELLEALQEGAPIKAIAIDSIKAIRYPKDIRENTAKLIMGGSGSQYLGSALKLVIPVIAKYNILTFFVQQVTMEMDPMKALRNPFVITEGKALKHCADLMLEIIKLDTKAGVIESGETISGASQQTGHKVRVKVKKNRLGVPARMALFTWHYDLGVIDTGAEIFELAKSLNIVFHPKNAEGRENNQMWQFGNYDPIRGEANIKAFVTNSLSVQKEVLAACYEVQDARVQLDASNTVIDDGSAIDLDLEG